MYDREHLFFFSIFFLLLFIAFNLQNMELILYLQPVRYIKSFYLNPVSSINCFFSLEKDNWEGLWINDPQILNTRLLAEELKPAVAD